MKFNISNSGYTFIELLVVIAILTFLLVTGLPAYANIKNNIALKNEAYEIVNALRVAQNRSVVSFDLSEHGVYFESDNYIEFTGDDYAGATETYVHPLAGGISVTSGAGTEIVFSRLLGETAGATITIEAAPGHDKTITVNEAGKITVN